MNVLKSKNDKNEFCHISTLSDKIIDSLINIAPVVMHNYY